MSLTFLISSWKLTRIDSLVSADFSRSRSCLRKSEFACLVYSSSRRLAPTTACISSFNLVISRCSHRNFSTSFSTSFKRPWNCSCSRAVWTSKHLLSSCLTRRDTAAWSSADSCVWGSLSRAPQSSSSSTGGFCCYWVSEGQLETTSLIIGFN